jgi:hypothetical protein
MPRMARIVTPDGERAHSILAVASGMSKERLGNMPRPARPSVGGVGTADGGVVGVEVAKRPRGRPRKAENKYNVPISLP